MRPRLEIRFSLSRQWAFCFGKPYSPAANEFLLNRARSGIMIALKALDLPLGSHIGVMAYNCHTVFNAIKQAGYTPVFLDVTDTLTLDFDDLRKKHTSIQALVISHLFGIISDVNSIREEYPDLPIIEDCAHAFGMQSSHGDFCVFSIGQGKLPSLGDGGILLVNNENNHKKTASLYDELPSYSPFQCIMQWGKMVFKSILYSPCIYGCITTPMKRKRKAASGIETIIPRKMSNGVRSIFESERSSFPGAIAQRLENTQKMESILTRTPGVRNVLSGSINGFMAIAYCDNLPLAMSEMRRKRIETATHFAHCIYWAKEFGYTTGTCPKTEKLISHLLMAPTYK